MYYWQLMKWWVDFKKVPAINSVRLQKPEKDYCLFSAVAYNLSRSIYKITKILLASRLVKNPIIYCSGKPIENWSLFIKAVHSIFYQLTHLIVMLREHQESL